MKKMASSPSIFALLATSALLALPNLAHAALSFTVGGTWDSDDRKNAAISALTAAIARFNAYANFGNYNIYAYYNSGIPTAQASYLGSIGYGGTYPNERVTMHEMSHYLGTGTTSGWSTHMVSGVWNGTMATALVKQFDGDQAVLNGDTQHYWPYGLNYDSEGSEINKQREVAMVYALRGDLGLGPTSLPSSYAATSVTLIASDAMGESGFNYASKWSDNAFAHANADYYSGNYLLRTPASSNSFTFVGKSLTINNTNGSSGGLLFKGSGTSAVTTFSDLRLAGGYIRHASSAGDLFQLAGNLTVSGASTIHAQQGSINVLATLKGSGSITIPVADLSTHYVRLLASNNTFTGNFIVQGRFELAANANQRFLIGANGINNSISGSSAQSVLLNGLFDLDLSATDPIPGSVWTLVSTPNTSYGDTFAVRNFAEISPGLWSNSDGFLFSESTGKLTVVPEPASLALLALASLSLLHRRTLRHASRP